MTYPCCIHCLYRPKGSTVKRCYLRWDLDLHNERCESCVANGE